MKHSVAMILDLLASLVPSGGQLFYRPRNRSYFNLLMVNFEGSEPKVKVCAGLAIIPALCLLLVSLFLPPPARAQGTTEFMLTMTSLDPVAIAPGGTSSTSIRVDPLNGYSGTVTLGCQVTANQPTSSTPVCTVSPATVTPSATATATITSTIQTTTVGYGITITAAGATTSYSAPPLQLTVLAVTPQFTINVINQVAPTSVPAGSGAQGTVSVNPINGYSTPNGGGIILYCSSITPLVTIAPVCSFAYPNNSNVLTLQTTNAQNATLTINTFGPVVTGAAVGPRHFYAVWLALPLLGLVGLGITCGGKGSRKALGLLAVFVVSAAFLLLPSCAPPPGTTTVTPNGITPANTYTFTIVGIDSNGVVSSNSGTSTTATTVTLTVTAPPKP